MNKTNRGRSLWGPRINGPEPLFTCGHGASTYRLSSFSA